MNMSLDDSKPDRISIENLTFWNAFKMRFSGIYKHFEKPAPSSTVIIKEVSNKPLLVVVKYDTIDGRILHGVRNMAVRCAQDVMTILESGKLGYVTMPDFIKLEIV